MFYKLNIKNKFMSFFIESFLIKTIIMEVIFINGLNRLFHVLNYPSVSIFLPYYSKSRIMWSLWGRPTLFLDIWHFIVYRVDRFWHFHFLFYGPSYFYLNYRVYHGLRLQVSFDHFQASVIFEAVGEVKKLAWPKNQTTLIKFN